MNAGNTENDQATRAAVRVASLLKSAVAGLGTFWGTFDHFGAIGSMFIVAFVLVLIGSSDWIVWPIRRVLARVPWLNASDTTNRFTVLVGAGVFVVACILWGCDVASVRIFRKDFTRVYNQIPIKVARTAKDHFPNPTPDDTRSQKDRDRAALGEWVRWMWTGANQVIPATTPATAAITPTLLYLEGKPFDSSYATFESTLTLSAGLTIDGVAAFLLANDDDTIWYKPSWRQLVPNTCPDDHSVRIMVSNPNATERLVVFVRVLGTLPADDQFVPSGHFEVRP